MSNVTPQRPLCAPQYLAGAAAFALVCAGCSQAPVDEAQSAVEAEIEALNADVSGAPAGVKSLCATADEAALVRKFYTETRPGAPLPIPGRKLDLPESKIASGLSADLAIGIDGSPERLADVWRTIDDWGADTPVRVVVSIDGWHPFDFPSKVPVTQAKHNPGFYDVYADNGDGVHIHINPDDVNLIYAANVPAPDGTAGRSVNLYDSDGRLIIGVYASSGGKPENADAVAGFNGTWALLASLPRACEAESIEG